MSNTADYITKKHFDEEMGELKGKFNTVLEKLDWLIGKYEAHDQEHELLNHRVSEHSDNLETINQKLGIQI